MDNPNSMLGLLGMESTSFLEELTRSDDLSPMPTQGGSVNGTILQTGDVDIPRQQMQASMWGAGQPMQSSMMYGGQDHVQFGVLKQQQQRMGQMASYGSGLMPSGNGGAMPVQSGGGYAYGGMSVNAQQPQHNISMSAPRQMMPGSAMWNQNPSVMSSDHSATSYQGVSSIHGAMNQQHVGMMGQIPTQGSVSMNRTNGMPGQMYGQYHSEYSGPSRGMVGYGDAQQQQAAGMAMSGGGYGQQTPQMTSPPPASNRLSQMSMMGSGGVNAPHLPAPGGSYQQHHYQSMQGGPGGNESSPFAIDAQSPHTTPAGHSMNQGQSYQYMPGSGNGMMPGHSGQSGMSSDNYGQFYAQPLYRMQNYPIPVTQSQMLSPGAVQSMSSPSRANSVRLQQHAQSPTPMAASVRHGVIGVGAVPSSSPFRQNVPRQSFNSASVNIPNQVVQQQRMIVNDVAGVNYGPSGGSSSVGPSASASLAGMMNASARYTSPGYQMNSVSGTQQMVSGGSEIPNVRPVYNVQSQQPQQTSMLEIQDRMQTYQQQQQYQQQIYYQQQQSQQVVQQQVQHQVGVQQQQLIMMNSGVSPGQLMSHQTVQQMSPSTAAGETTTSTAVLPNNRNAVTHSSPQYLSPPQRAIQQTVPSDLDSSGSVEAPTLHLPDMRMQFTMPASSMSSSPPALTAPSSTRDDEPLSTPPPLDVQDDANCTFFPSQVAVKPNPVTSSNAMNFVGETVAEDIAVTSLTEDLISAEAIEKKAKKKRKRKSEVVEGELNGEVPVKKARKKKPKVDVGPSVDEVVEHPVDAGLEVSGFDSSVLDSSGLDPTAAEGSLAEGTASETASAGHITLEEDSIKQQDLEIDISATVKRSRKGSKRPKTPKEPRVQKEKKEKKPKEPKSQKESSKSGRTGRKNASRSINKSFDVSDEGTVLGSAADVTESAQEELPETEVVEEKPKPIPRPKSKKRRPLPTFLKSKKKRRSVVSDVSDAEHTPPPSPADDSSKRRSSRVTKKQKYMEDVDLTDDENHAEADLSVLDAVTGAVAVEESPADEDTQIVEKFISSRIVKRKINLKTGFYVEDVKEKTSTSEVRKCSDLIKQHDPVQNETNKIVEPGDAEASMTENAKKEDSIEEVKDSLDDTDAQLDEKISDETKTVSEVNDNSEPSAIPEVTEQTDSTEVSEAKETNECGAVPEVTVLLDPTAVPEATEKPVPVELKAEEVPACDPEDIGEVEVEEFYVKYKNFSYLHCEWRTADELELGDRRVMQKIKRYKQKKSMQHEYLAPIDDDELFNQEYVEVDRVLDMKSGDDCAHYLVKWRGLPYEESTWELATDIDNDKIQAFHQFKELPPESERKFKNRPSVKEWKTLEETRIYKNGNTLREYQLEGLNWLTFCFYSKQNCILADEMGLGKTIQSITFLEHVFGYGIRGPFLVIVPLSTLGNWQREFEAWTDLNVIVYHGSSASRNMLQQYEMYYKDEKGRRIPDIYRFHALVTTYEVIISDLEQLQQIDWRVAVIDEAHRLKNRNCKLLQGLSCFDVEHRVLLTGTPLQNNVEELFSLLNFLEPKQFTSSEAFMADFGKLESETQVDKLKAILKPMMLRRLKEDVEKSLAPKEETIIEVELTNIQKKYYRAILERNFSFLAKGTTAANIPNLMNTMMELRKCCNHPYLINGAEDQVLEELRGNSRSSLDLEKMFVTMVHSSGKLVLIDKLLPKLKADGHKVLIFSQMIRVLDIIEDYIIHKKYLYERIDGRIRGNLRQESIDRFSKPDSDKFIFLLCTRAGGLGINLTAADTVIIYDSDWNPQNDLQAQARCHRIGQQKSVKVYRLITRNTYEREMFDRASLKLGLDKAVLQSMGTKDLNTSNQLSKKEIEDLLKKGAYGALMDDDTAGSDFCEEDIDHILQRRTQVVQIEAGVKGSTFAKASFSLTTNRNDINIDDPEFWQKWAKKADVDAASLMSNKNDLIIEMPRQRKQVCRYGKQDEAVRISDLETSDSEVEEDETNGNTAAEDGTPGQRVAGGKRKLKGGRGRDTEDMPFVPDNSGKEGYSRSDCFTVEKNLLVFGWGRWIDIQRHGHFKRQLEVEDIRNISRAMLLFSLQHYEGDDRIKMFIFDLVSASVDGQEKDYRNHTGLSAPVPRGRKGRRGKKIELSTPPKKSQFCEDLSKLDIDPNRVLADPGYRKHLQRHAIKLLLRVRLLYYLRQEVIGPEADKVLSGAPASEINIVMPFVDGEVPVYWWDSEADRCMVIGVFKHGYEKYNQMRQDPGLCFFVRCGPPDGSALLAEEIDNEDEMKDDEDDEDQQTPRRRGGRTKKDNIFNNLDDIDDVGTPNSSKAPSVSGALSSEASATQSVENGKHPFPGISDLNSRLRRIVAAFQKNHKKELMKQEQNEKRMMRREQFDCIIKQREEARVVALQKYVIPISTSAPHPHMQSVFSSPHGTVGTVTASNNVLMMLASDRAHWSRREEADFYRVVSTFGVERDSKTIEFQWEKFRGLARLDKKRDETLTEYFRAFYQMCMNVCRRTASDENGRSSTGTYIEPITEERANRCLARIDLLCKIREQILTHPLLDERLKLCQSSSDIPDWWCCGMHDKDLLIGAAKHGLSRTDYHIQYDPQLNFRKFVRERRGRTSLRNVSEATSQINKDASETPPLKPSNDETLSATNILKGDISETGLRVKVKDPCLSGLTVREISADEEDGALNLVTVKKTEIETADVPVKSEEITKSEPELKPVTAREADKETSAVHKEDDDETLSESEAGNLKDFAEAGNVKDFGAQKFSNDSNQNTPLKWKSDVEGVALPREDDDVLDRSAVTSPYPDQVTFLRKSKKYIAYSNNVSQNAGDDDGNRESGEHPAMRWTNQWPKDRVVFHRLESICHCIERGEWPAAHRYMTPNIAAADSHSSTPMPGTPTSSTPMMALAAADCSSGNGSSSIMAAIERMHEGPKLPFQQQQRRRRRTKAEMEADRMKRMREIITASMTGSSLDAASGHCRRVLEGEDDSGTSSSEIRRPDIEIMPVVRRRRGRRPKIEKLLEASAIESAMAARGSNLTGSAMTSALPSTGLAGGNLMWPPISAAGFEQYVSRLADAAGLSAESRRLFISEISRAANLQDSSSSVGANFTGDISHSHSLGNDRPETSSHKATDGASETERRILEVVSSVKRAHQLDVEAAITQEYEPRWPAADERRVDGDRESPLHEARLTKAESKQHHTFKDSAGEDGETQQPMNLVSAEQDNQSDKDTGRLGHGDGHGLRSRQGLSEQALQRECMPSGDLSREHSRYSAGEEEEEAMSRARMHHPEHDAVSRWLAEHRNAFDRQAVEDEVQSELEQALGQRQRRRPRLDPAKIDVNHVSGDENVSVVNRSSGKRITGAKAPPIRYLKEWLLRNPEFDVDPKWGHIVKARGNLPEDMQSRILMPSGRGRRSNAAIAAAAAMSSTSSPLPPAPQTSASDFYSMLANLSAMTGGSSAAASLMGYAGMPYSLGLGALGLTNPMYAASLASLGILPGMAALSGLDGGGDAEMESKGDKSVNSKDKEHHGSAADTDDMGANLSASIHPSFPYMYNPLLFNPLYAQSLAAAAASNLTLPGPFGALGLGLGGSVDASNVVEELAKVAEPKPQKLRKVTDSPALAKPKERVASESYRGSKSYSESKKSGLSEEPPRRRESFADSGAFNADQAEPEDLSVLSTKHSKVVVTSNVPMIRRTSEREELKISRLGTAAVEACDEVEDLSRKSVFMSVPVASVAVEKSRNFISKSGGSPSPMKSDLLQVLPTAGEATKAMPVREGVASSKPQRSRSRLIDSIGTKLMAKRQKVQTDVADFPKPADESPESAACRAPVCTEEASSITAAVEVISDGKPNVATHSLDDDVTVSSVAKNCVSESSAS